MNCPKCTDTLLVMSERQQVEIDYCPVCRGVWLDRGELDKLIERSAAHYEPAQAVQSANPSHSRVPDFVDSDQHRSHRQPVKRKKSWLNEIFD
jgi:uncharacterized protein